MRRGCAIKDLNTCLEGSLDQQNCANLTQMASQCITVKEEDEAEEEETPRPYHEGGRYCICNESLCNAGAHKGLTILDTMQTLFSD